MSQTDTTTTLQELKELMVEFREARGWSRHMTPKNIAISIALEAAELLEHYQWDDDYARNDKDAAADELIDVIITCISMATILDIDIADRFTAKLERIKKKYPVEVFNPKGGNSKEYYRIKNQYRAKGKQT